ncbi:MAG: hypothetical protein QXJ28_03175 [Candidatus Pacearchaeota archaeon]
MGKGVILVFCVFVILSIFIFENVFSEEIKEDIGNYLVSVVSEVIFKAAGKDKITLEKVSKLNQDELPNRIVIEKVKENNVGIYEIEYKDREESKSLFLLTYATNSFKEKSNVSSTSKAIQLLNFGYKGESEDSDYLEVFSGVKTGPDKGYIMIRSGSITGISSSLDLRGEGEVEISVYKNGVDTGFRNLIGSTDSKKIDYDIQSEGALTFNPGDIISVYVSVNGDVIWSNDITLVEITFN